MNGKKNILFFISSGFAFRNFICSGIIDILKEKYNISIIIPKIYNYSMKENAFENYNIIYSEPIFISKSYRFLRSIIIKIENKRLGNYDPFFRKWHIKISKGKQKILTALQYMLSDLCNRDYIYLTLKNLEEKILNSLKNNLIFPENTHLLISTNPFSSFEYPYIFYAKQENIKNLSIILSWDNLLWMGKLPVESDYFFVWGPEMRKDLKRHFPSFPEENIYEVGSPQFDFHRDPGFILEKEKFYSIMNIKDINKKIICYSANIPEHFNSEPVLIEKILESIKEKRIKYNPIFVLRIHPHDNTERFQYLEKKYPDIILNKLTQGNKEHPTWFIPKKEDLVLFSNLIRYSSLNINLASTVTLDFAYLDKPVINIAFTPLKKDPLGLRIPYYYNSLHYRKVVELGGVGIVYSMDELEKEINNYLERPEMLSAERKRLVEQLCGGYNNFSRDKIIEGIKKIINEKDSFLH